MILPGVVIEFDSASRWWEGRIGRMSNIYFTRELLERLDRGVIKQEFLLGFILCKKVINSGKQLNLGRGFLCVSWRKIVDLLELRLLWMSLLYHSWNSERIEIVMVCLFCVVCFRFSVSIDLGLVAICEVGSGLFVLMCSFVCRWTCRLCIEDLGLFRWGDK